MDLIYQDLHLSLLFLPSFLRCLRVCFFAPYLFRWFARSPSLFWSVGRSDVIYCKGSESSCLSLSYPPIGIEAGRLRDWFDRQQYLQLKQPFIC